ncbi:hypothetical protein [Caballeronia concitans]|uniref:Uncharacterized protein n=1 Tax=Caballeronia concitans TaxID=1777133 RepID=A0A658QTK8_9BURK|nr:hypothetical protein [Caballeronia concitans]KIG10845.1 hypothetical protein BurMR1_2209 [Burkholderia sp. MR1]SAL19858.1 hypothetical protein AWB72_01263 [Caballeronia concitans]
MKPNRLETPVGQWPSVGRSMAPNAPLFGLLLVLNIAIPKAGFKVGDVPITFGYMYALLLGVVCLPSGLARFFNERQQTAGVVAYCSFIFVFMLLAASFCGIGNMGFFLSIILGFCVLPVALIISMPNDPSTIRALETYLVWSVRFAVTYGILLFFYKLSTGEFIEIPYVTVNADDVGKLGTKYIQRSDNLSKLISTYNNGNIFGVCILMLLPLYDLVERRSLMRILARVALLLTLSRTVWAVLLFHEAVFVKRPVWQRMLMLAIGILGIVASLQVMGTDAGFLTDLTLGGRTQVVDELRVSIFPRESFDYVSEILWVSVAYFGGLIGLFLFGGLFTMILVGIRRLSPGFDLQRCALIGVVNFILCSFVDAAANYIPTMFIFWLVVWIGFLDRRTNRV